MSVFRINKNSNYTTMSNYHLKDKNLSLKAKGLLSVMLSLNDDWNYSVAGLCSISKENETAINSALKELKNYGYLVVSKERKLDGKFEYNYDIFERPTLEKPLLEKPPIENMGMANNININNTKEVNTKDKILNNKEISIINNTKEMEIFEHWNKKNIIIHRDFNKLEKKIKEALKEHDLETIKSAIDHYSEVINNQEYFYKYKWTLEQFLSRGKGLVEFTDKGSKWLNYLDFKNKNKSKEISRQTAYPEYDDVGYIR